MITNVLPRFLKLRLQDTTGCQTGCQTGLTTGLIIVLNEQLFVQPVVRPGCTTGLTTGLTTGCIVYTNIYPVVKSVWQPVWQQVVSCKRGFTVSSWLIDWFYAENKTIFRSSKMSISYEQNRLSSSMSIVNLYNDRIASELVCTRHRKLSKWTCRISKTICSE